MTNKKLVKDLTTEELEKVLENNTILKQEVYNAFIEDQDFWISEYLNVFEEGAIKYSISCYGRGDYLKITDYESFLSGLVDLQSDYCFLEDSYNAKIEYARELLAERDNLDAYDDNFDSTFDKLEDALVDACSELRVALYKQLKASYDTGKNDEYLTDYFIECYVDNYIAADRFFVDEDYNMFEEVHYIKSYK